MAITTLAAAIFYGLLFLCLNKLVTTTETIYLIYHMILRILKFRRYSYNPTALDRPYYIYKAFCHFSQQLINGASCTSGAYSGTCVTIIIHLIQKNHAMQCE